MLCGSQIRAARALLKITTAQLAEMAGLSYAAVQRAESFDGVPNMLTKNLASVKDALESAGVIFVEENGEGLGVRLRK